MACTLMRAARAAAGACRGDTGRRPAADGVPGMVLDVMQWQRFSRTWYGSCPSPRRGGWGTKHLPEEGMMADERNLTERGVDNSIEGKLKHAGGHIKDAVGGLTGDKSLQTE